MAMLMTVLKYTGLFILTLTLIDTVYRYVFERVDKQNFPPMGRMVDVGGYKLHMIDQGQGGPIVVIDSGVGCNSFDWSLIQPEIAKFTRVITYDRAGYAWSDASPLPRTSENIVDELHAMLQNAGIQGPYVLVGHSFGGMNVQLFAKKYPNEVAGIVLVDAVHENVMKIIPQIFVNFKGYIHKKLLYAYVGIFRMMADIKLLYKPLSDKNKMMNYVYKNSATYYRTLFNQLDCIQKSCDQVEAVGGSLGGIPLIVISAGKEVIPVQGPCGDYYTQQEADGINKHWQDLQVDLVTKSTRGKQVVARQSGHNIPAEQPDIIVESVREIIDDYKR